MPFAATWMNLEVILLSEVSQTKKHKYYMKSLICRALKMIQMNLFTKQKDTQNQRMNLWLPGGKGRERELGSLGLTCTHCCIKNGQPTRTYCIAQGTLLNILFLKNKKGDNINKKRIVEVQYRKFSISLIWIPGRSEKWRNNKIIREEI